MTFEKVINDEKIILSDDTGLIRDLCNRGQPAILILNESNKDEDTFFARYAVQGSDMEDIDDYCRRVIASAKGESLVIAITDRLIIRELKISDLPDITAMYDEGTVPFLKSFYQSHEEAEVILRKYIDNVYGFYGYGIWGIFDRKDERFTGLVGLSNRDREGKTYLELGYAVVRDRRRQGIGTEACRAVLEYAKNNIDYEDIIINVDRENIPALKLAEKIKLKFTEE